MQDTPNKVYEFENKFLQIHKFIQKFEGHFINHPSDRGGMTIQGIARNFHPNWQGWEFIDNLLSENKSIEQINEITSNDFDFQNLVTEFYYNTFYKNYGYDRFDFQLGLALTDATILFGFKRVSKNLQKIINNYLPQKEHIKVDGYVGNNSYKALDKVLKKVTQREIALALLIERVDDILETVDYRPKNKVFQRGWLNRVLKVYNLIKRDY